MRAVETGKIKERWARVYSTLAFFPLTCFAFCIGCATATGPDAAFVATVIEQTSRECRLERENRVALGGIKMSVVKTLVRVSGETEAADLLAPMKRVEVITYRVSGTSACSESLDATRLGDEFLGQGWRPMVLEREDSGQTWVYEHENRDGDLDGLLVVALDAAELEVVRVDGDIGTMMAEALKADIAEGGQLVRLMR